jgi:Xaa-Pro aminopeptidase
MLICQSRISCIHYFSHRNLISRMKEFTVIPDFFSRNRARLSNSLNKRSLAIINSNDEMVRTADQFYPFRQNSDLFYLTGINQEKTVLILFPDFPEETMREMLFIRSSSKKLETWDGHKLTLEEAARISGIKTIKWLDDLESTLAQFTYLAKCIYINLPENPKFIPELPSRDHRFVEELRRKLPLHQMERLAPVIHRLRVIKADEEIELIREACRITGNAFKRILATLKPDMVEYEIEAELTFDFIRNGARGHAYQPIIASGINACTLHYIANNKECKDGELLLMDFGAEVANYAADCTRTIPVNGKFTPRQRQVYDAVQRVFTFARSLMKPGKTINLIHNEVCSLWEKEHIKLGLYTSAERDQQDKETPLWQRYYMHGTSHFLGLDVHDVGSKDAEFRPNMVLTCEPAIYIPEEGIGIRLENNILITDEGNIDLMQDIPMDADEIERLMKNR